MGQSEQLRQTVELEISLGHTGASDEAEDDVDEVAREWLKCNADTVAELKRIEEQVVALKERQRHAYEDWLASHNRKRVRIGVLPNEVIRVIFKHCAFSRVTDGKWPRFQGSTAMALCHVCSKWRSVALGITSLWSTIHDPQNAEWMDCHISRSNDALLYVSLEYPFSKSKKRLAGEFSAQLRALAQSIHRVPYLRICCDWTKYGGGLWWSQIFRSLPAAAPVMEELSFVFANDNMCQTPQNQIAEVLNLPVFPNGAPKLTKLTSYLLAPTSISPVVQDAVTHLRLLSIDWEENSPQPPPFQLLGQLSNLVSLSICAAVWQSLDAHVIELPSVKDLTVVNDVVYNRWEEASDDEEVPIWLDSLETVLGSLWCTNLESLALRHWDSSRLRHAFEAMRGKNRFHSVRALKIVTQTLDEVWTIDSLRIFPDVTDLSIFADNAYTSGALPINSGDIRRYLAYDFPQRSDDLEIEFMPKLKVLTLGPYFRVNLDSSNPFRTSHSTAYAVRELSHFLRRRSSYGKTMDRLVLHTLQLSEEQRSRISKLCKRVVAILDPVVEKVDSDEESDDDG